MNASKRKSHRVVVLVSGLLLLAASAFVPRRIDDAPLRVAVSLWPGSEPLLAARDRGILPDAAYVFLEGIWPSAVFRAFDNDAVDVAVLTEDEIARLRGNGESVRVLCFIDESRGADAVVAGRTVASVADLKGRKVGVVPQGPGLHLLEEALSGAGLSVSDVTIVSLFEPDLPLALEGGEVAAVVASEPWIRRLAGSGGKVLFDTATVESPVWRMLVAKEGVVRERREALVELVRAHLEMTRRWNTPDSAGDLDATLARLGMSMSDFLEMTSRIRFIDLEENLDLMAGELDGRFFDVEEDGSVRVIELSSPAIEENPWTERSIMEEAVR